jgi:hypothetical protein
MHACIPLFSDIHIPVEWLLRWAYLSAQVKQNQKHETYFNRIWYWVVLLKICQTILIFVETAQF